MKILVIEEHVLRRLQVGSHAENREDGDEEDDYLFVMKREPGKTHVVQGIAAN